MGRPSDDRAGPLASLRGTSALVPGQIATVRDLLSVIPLRLTLVAGAAGLDRPIRWAHSIELLDPRPYLRGHELVLTMGSVLQDGAACEAFVQAVLEREASGIGFGCGNYHPTAPTTLRLACEEAGLPLLEVPHEVPFMAITEELAERLAVQRGERDRRTLRREAHLLDVLAEGHGLDGVVRALARELGCTIVVTDPSGTVEAIDGPERGRLKVGAMVAAALSEVRPGAQRTAYGDGAVSAELVAIRHQQRSIGWLGLLRGTDESHPEALEVLYEAAPIVSIGLATRAQERTRDRQAVGRLLEMVRTGVADPVILVERIDAVRLDRVRLVASVWGADAAEVLRQALPRAVIGEAGSRTIAVTDDPDRVAEVAATSRIGCGIGSVVPLRELVRSLLEAEAAFDIKSGPAGVMTWRHLASLSTLLGQQPAGRLDGYTSQLIVPIVEYDVKHAGELLATLRMFIGQEGAVEATARQLYVHPNTLRHRLRRIRTLTGRDPFAFLDRAAFYIGLWAWDAQDRRIPQERTANIVGSDD